MTQRPIEPRDYISGVKVVDIGDIRVARGQTRVHAPACKHRNMVYDEAERRIYCRDCEQDVDAFDAFLLLIQRYDAAAKRINRLSREIDEAAKFHARSLAVKALDTEWRKRNSVPNCPHCNEALLPEDILSRALRTSSPDLVRKKRGVRSK